VKFVVIAALFVMAGCSSPIATPSPQPSPTAAPSAPGLSAEEARPLLLANAGAAATGIEWMRQGELGDFVDIGTVNIDFRRPVWAALLTGTWAMPCIPRRSCPPDFGTSLVVIDYYTGEFITQTMSR
jgi:hypothetical protein